MPALGRIVSVGSSFAKALNISNGHVGHRAQRIIVGDNRTEACAGVNEFSRRVDVEKSLAVVTSRSPETLALNPLSIFDP
jgi:hypothetical protein